VTDTNQTQEGSAALTDFASALAEAGATSLATRQQKQLAERLLQAALTRWEDPQLRPRLLEHLIAALTTEAGADKMRDVLSSQIFTLFGKALESSQTTDINQAADILKVPPLNINAAQAQVWGTIVLRYILKVEPIASVPADELLDLLTPTIQRYLAGFNATSAG
jgi:Tetracyclin repressor-like, C-terminal domain